MREFLIKISVIGIVVYATVFFINYNVDSANIVHDKVVYDAVDYLAQGEIIESPGDLDEGLFYELMSQKKANEKFDIAVIGSSHVLYVPWGNENTNYFVWGLSGAYLGDYYAIMGMLEYYKIQAEKVIIGVDPWALQSDASTGRHSSISKYSVYEESNVRGINSSIHFSEVKSGLTFEKMKELFSFPYLQSSVRKVRWGGIKYLKNKQEKIAVCLDDSTGDKMKILPSCRKIMSKDMYWNTEEINQYVLDVVNTAKANTTNPSIYQLRPEKINNENFNEFISLLSHLKSMGIEVEIYLPSWHPIFYDYFREEDGFYCIIELEDKVRQRCNEFEITVHGSYDPVRGGVDEKDFADWLHLTPDKMLDNYCVIERD